MNTSVSIIHGKEKEQLNIVMAFQGENRFLSNFWPCNVILPAEIINKKELPEMVFETVENAYQAWKSSSFKQRQMIQNMKPGKAKDFSRTNEFQIREDLTDNLRIQAMGMLIEQKFSDKNLELKNMLLNKEDALLIEGNDWNDNFFGFCLKTGQGQNHLGRLIMKTRNNLKS